MTTTQYHTINLPTVDLAKAARRINARCQRKGRLERCLENALEKIMVELEWRATQAACAEGMTMAN